jgi:hypothetical protein
MGWAEFPFEAIAVVLAANFGKFGNCSQLR